MNEIKKNKMDKSSWVIGGGAMLGIGVGFFLLHISALYFVGSTMAGIGLGLLLSPFADRK